MAMFEKPQQKQQHSQRQSQRWQQQQQQDRWPHEQNQFQQNKQQLRQEDLWSNQQNQQQPRQQQYNYQKQQLIIPSVVGHGDLLHAQAADLCQGAGMRHE